MIRVEFFVAIFYLILFQINKFEKRKKWLLFWFRNN